MVRNLALFAIGVGIIGQSGDRESRYLACPPHAANAGKIADDMPVGWACLYGLNGEPAQEDTTTMIARLPMLAPAP